MKPFPVVMPLVLRWKRGYLPMLYVSLIYSDLDLFMIYSRSFCDAMLARVVSAYECMGEVTQLLSGFAQVTQLLCDLGRRARARSSSPSHATHNDPGILVFVTSGSFFTHPPHPLDLFCSLLARISSLYSGRSSWRVSPFTRSGWGPN